MVSISRKKNKKQKRFVINQEPFPQAKMKDSLKNTMLPFESASEKNQRKRFPLAEIRF